jgi:hypothetical protein
MSEPLPHFVNIAKKLKSYGIDGSGEPMMLVLGGAVVTAEIDAKSAFRRLTSILAQVETEEGDLDSFDSGHLGDAAQAVATYERARRELLRTAEELGLRRQVATP